MTLLFLFAVWLFCSSFAPAQDAPKERGRFFNDSPKAVTFYLDGQFACSVPANPEKNNSYCDVEIGKGRHLLLVEGPKL